VSADEVGRCGHALRVMAICSCRAYQSGQLCDTAMRRETRLRGSIGGHQPLQLLTHEGQKLLSVAYSNQQGAARRHGGRRRDLRRWDAQSATPAVSDVIQAFGL
jgi:hypothetical protein